MNLVSAFDSANLGIPIATQVLDDVSFLAAVLLLQVLAVAPVIVVALDRHRDPEWRARVRRIASRPVRNPVILASLLSVACSTAGLHLPSVAAAPLTLLADAAVPAALVALGASLHERDLVNWALTTGFEAVEHLVLRRQWRGSSDECGLADITSRAFVVRRGNDVLAAAGYRHWPGHVAHLGVLTRPDRRGRELARAVSSAAVADALAHDLLPQWRARPGPSRRVARALGFRQLGTQLSLSLAEE
ncbi:GNAT family N-acetyltransferase [Micromonospora sp. NPDC050980]|uniref:GNAT family N-acetyltransferase n=1 Tax=Micromonospora sp. NPDC050980 TaxID=3155161 RepID=UPI0033F29D09